MFSTVPFFSVISSLRTAFCVVLFVSTLTGLSAGVIFVREGNPTAAAPFGSWSTAAANLQDALALSSSGDQIWVAEGVYSPDRGTSFSVGDRSASFELVAGVEIYGGFPADGTIVTLDGRMPRDHETVLSGDLNRDDGAGFANRSDNSRHVLKARGGIGPEAVLDGFTVSGGNANDMDESGVGAGLFCDNASPLVRGCRFSGNESAIQGGAIALQFGSNAVFVNCEFRGNRSGVYGGVAFIVFSKGSFLSCLFSGNQSASNGGVINNSAGFSDFINCTFTGNRAGGLGGVFFSNAGTSESYNCIFWANGAEMASTPAEVTYLDDFVEGVPFFENCVVDGLSSDFLNSGFGDNNFNSALGYHSPRFISEIDWTSAPTEEGDFRLGDDSGTLDRGTPDAKFSQASAKNSVADVSTDLLGNPRVVNGLVDLGAYESSNLKPSVLRMSVENFGPVEASTLEYDIVFTEAVVGVESLDTFVLETSGSVSTGPLSVGFIEGSGTYRFTISEISGDGTIAMRLKSGGSVRDLSGEPLATFPTLESVVVFDRPRVSSSAINVASPTNSSEIVYRVQFTEPVQGFSEEEDLLVLAGREIDIGTVEIAELDDGQEYEIRLSDVFGDGEVEVVVSLFGGIRDLAGYDLHEQGSFGSFLLDQTKPVVSVLGDSVIIVDVGSSWVDPGATASDNIDDAVEVEVLGGTIDTAISGTYEITYRATDRAGNVAEEKRFLIVGDPSPVQQWALDSGLQLFSFMTERDTGRSLTALERYAFGLGLNDPSVPLLLEGDSFERNGTPVFRKHSGDGDHLLHFYYLSRENAQSLGLRYVLQTSSDLSNWETEDSFVTEILATSEGMELNRVLVPELARFTRIAIALDF